MTRENQTGTIVILNGVPRSGKSSIAKEIQRTFDGIWLNIGVDRFMDMTPERYLPGIGLRPGGERPDLEPYIVDMFTALYESIAVYSRNGFHIVVDVGHHDSYSAPLNILPDCAHILNGLHVLFVGVRCPIDVVMKRRIETWNKGYTKDGHIPDPVKRWQESVHQPGIYDLEVDTGIMTPSECADKISSRLESGVPFSALKQLRENASDNNV